VNLLDIVITAILLLAAGMGARRGLKSGLYLIVTLLSILLAVILLTAPLEKLILNIVGIGSEKYPDAPAVAVLILEGRAVAAYAAALLPAFITLSLLLLFGLLIARIGWVRQEKRSGFASRILGAILGLCAGISFTFLFAAQLMRLSWPLPNQMLRGSLIISTLDYIAHPILSMMAGGP